MRSFIAATALAAGALAQSNYPVQSAPFTLSLISDDNLINGRNLIACHTGAAIESLCIYPSDNPVYFYLNSSTTTIEPNPNRGLLTWDLRGSEFISNEPLTFFYQAGTNVVLPLFEPSSFGQEVIFEDDKLGVQTSFDDTVTPPKYLDTPKTLNNWYICQTYYASYTYTTLAWSLGPDAPQNPSCKKVDVKRVFASQK